MIIMICLVIKIKYYLINYNQWWIDWCYILKIFLDKLIIQSLRLNTKYETINSY